MTGSEHYLAKTQQIQNKQNEKLVNQNDLSTIEHKSPQPFLPFTKSTNAN